MSVGDSVVVSFYVGDANLSVSDFEIYHKGNNDSEWKLATDGDITNIEYKDGVLSFVARKCLKVRLANFPIGQQALLPQGKSTLYK